MFLWKHYSIRLMKKNTLYYYITKTWLVLFFIQPWWVWKHAWIQRTPLRFGRGTYLKRFLVNLYVLVANVFSESNLFCGTLICLLSFGNSLLNVECICWTGKSVTNAFPRKRCYLRFFESTKIIHVFLWIADRWKAY